VGASSEVCDDLDNNCDQQADEGCDKDADGYCDSAMSVAVDNPASCPQSLTGQGDDCDDSSTGATVNPGQTEVCDNIDNNCDQQVDEGCDKDGDGYCDSAMSVALDNPSSCPQSFTGQGDDCDDSASGALIHPGQAEVCDDIDNDCTAGADNGCDDDADGYCDAAMSVAIDNPTSCPQSLTGQGDDCNDLSDLANPGISTETCADGIDNNCDGLMDFQDTASCTFMSANITQAFISQIGSGPASQLVQPGQPMKVRHGARVQLQANISPATASTCTWSVTAARGNSCQTTDLTAPTNTVCNAGGRDTAAFNLPTAVGQLGCIYTIELRVDDGANGIGVGSVELEIVNRLPVLSLPGATYDSAADLWRVTVAPWGNTAPSVAVFASEAILAFPENDTPYTFAWSGTGLSALACSLTSCAPTQRGNNGQGLDLRPGIVPSPSPGIYDLTVTVNDGFDTTATVSANLQIEITNCLWVSFPPNGAGQADGSTPADGMGSIQAALNQAALTAGVDVCIAGAATYTEPNGVAPPLVLPVGVGTPDLRGGFDANGLPDPTMLPIIQITDDAGMTFDPGYDGTIRKVIINNISATAGVAVDATDASPVLDGSRISMPIGPAPVGLRVYDSGTSSAGTQVIMRGGGHRSSAGGRRAH